MNNKEHQKCTKASKLLVSALVAGALFASPSFAVEPSAYTLNEVGETDNWNYYDIVNGTNKYYKITPKSGTHYNITTDGTTDFSIKSLKPGTDSYSYHVTPRGTSADRVGDFNATIGSEGNPVVFRNISTNPQHPDKGGAVYNHNNAEGYSIYADFVSNTTTNYGGGVRNGYHSSAFIDKIIGDFVNNSAGDVGGAIANAPDCDTALGENPSINEIAGNFIGNSANNGGAIYNERIIGKITGDFLSNKSNDKGGAISNINIGTIGNTADSTSGIIGNFVSNTSQTGGAIYNEGTISNIEGDFILNTATTNGGAIHNAGAIGDMGLNTGGIFGAFIANSAVNGGAIYNNASGRISVINADFLNNTVRDSGGAVYNYGSGIINNISGNFENNTASWGGGAIMNYNGGNIISITGNFKNNEEIGTVENNIHGGGAIYNSSGSTIGSISGIFDSNKTIGVRHRGGAIYNSGKITNIDADFINNTSNSDAGAISNYNGATIDSLKGTFTGNTGYSGGAIWNYNSKITTIEADFISNIAINTVGGAINNNSTIENIINSNFISNKANNPNEGTGGAINNIGTIGKADNTGGIIANFIGNTALDGGAIYNTGIIASVAGNFTNNSASYGGAISNIQAGNITNLTAEFISNSASAYGGAIYNTKNIGSSINNGIIDSIFELNSSIASGGAIYNGNNGNIYIKDSTFTSNKAGQDGGAIYNVAALTIADSTFINNEATNLGGAIFNGNGGNLKVSADFAENSAKDGGAIYNYPGGTVNVSGYFTGNAATGSGGAIYNATNSSNVGTIYIKDSEFTNNTAKGDGGAIYNADKGEIHLLGDNLFEGNFENFNGTSGNPNDIYNDGSIYIDDAQVDSTTIIGTTVINGGINGEGTLFLLGNSTLGFGNNNAQSVNIDQNGMIMNDNSHLDMRNNLFDSIIVDEFGTMFRREYDKTSISFDTDLSDFDHIQNDKISTNKIVTGSAAGNKVILDIKSINVVKDNLQQLEPQTRGRLSLVTGTDVLKYNTFDNLEINDITVGTSNRVYNFKQNLMETSAQKGELFVSIVSETGFTLPQVIQANTKIGDEPVVIDSYSLTANQELSENEVLGTLARYVPDTPRDLAVFGNGHTIVANQKEDAGVIVNEDDSLLLDNIIMKNFTGDAITVNSDGMVDITNGSLIDGNIKNAGDLGIQNSIIGVVKTDKAGRVVNITGNIENTGTLDIEDSIVFGSIKDDTLSGTINTQGDVTILGGSTDSAEIVAAKANKVNINNGTLTVSGDVKFNETTIDNANLNMQIVDGIPNDVQADLGNLTLNSDTTFKMDANIKETTMSTVNVNQTGTNLKGNDINLDVKYYGTSTKTNFTLDPFENESTRTTLKDAINYQGQSITSPIFKYATQYDPARGLINVGVPYAGGAGNYNNFNPSVFAGPVAAQIGGYLNQLNSYDEAFANMDMQMLMTKEERTAMKLRNRYAGTNLGTYDPKQFPEERRGVWARPYASFEKVGLKGGPNVENTAYGTFLGGDSDLIELNHGWDFVYSAYASYDGSHQNFDGVSIYQNGGHLGGTAVWYKNNFFTGLTANVGASVAEASTMFGNESFPMLMAGIASKTGYNWELLKGRFIIQPSMLMSYSFVNTFNYKNAAGVSIDSDPLHAIQLAPGLKFIANLPHGWQPYIGVQMVWNIMDETKFQAQNVNLPQLSVKPYFQYGIGVQKRWGERCTGYFQTMLRNGGRNGVSLSAGFRFAIGKDPSNGTKSTNKTPELKKTELNLSNAR